MPTKKESIVISLGGSLLVPDGLDVEFIKNFKQFILTHIEQGYRFILVTGGGKTARRYIHSAGEVDR